MIDVYNDFQLDNFKQRWLDSPLASETVEQYLEKLVTHIRYVQEAAQKLGVKEAQWLIHDQSKFSDFEFPRYAQHFYGDDDPQEWQYALVHHMNNNQHHWQHWRLGDDWLKMPRKYALEMVADWQGAGRAYSGTEDMTEWLSKNWVKIKMHPETRSYIQEVLSPEYAHVFKQFKGVDWFAI